MRSTQMFKPMRPVARLIAATLLVALVAAGASAAADESVYQEQQSPGSAQAPADATNPEWLPACAPRVMIAAVYKENHRIHVIGYVKRGVVGRQLELRSRLGGGAVVRRFRPQGNGYFDVKAKRPHHRHADDAAWRVTGKGVGTPWVKLKRPLVLNNVHQRKSMLLVNGSVNVRTSETTAIQVQRLDDCHHASQIGQLDAPAGGRGPLDGSIQLRDITGPVSTMVRLRMRTKNRVTGKWGRSYWSLGLPVAIRP